jgi:hypothetical protein
MTAWQGLAQFVPLLRRYVDRAPADLPLRMRASWVTNTSLFGVADDAEVERRIDLSDPEVGNTIRCRFSLSMLAILSRCTPPTWLCRPAASSLIHATDLHSIPDAPPRLLRSPGVVETRRPETGEVLWDDYVSLGWYIDGDTIYLLGLRYPDGFATARWRPKWTGAELEPQLPGQVSPSEISFGDVEEHSAFARSAARYLVVLGLLAEVERGPLRIERDRGARTMQHVYRDQEHATTVRREPESAALTAQAVEVTGHIKRQRHGPGSTLTKWIYVTGYEARRWVGPREA